MIKICISVTSHALVPPPPCHKLSHLGPPPPSSVTYFMDGPGASLALVENCTYSVMQLRVIRPRRSYRFMLRKYWGRDQNDQCYTRTFAAGNVGKPHAGKTRLGVGPRGLGTQELSVDVLYALYGQPYAVLYFNTTSPSS